MTASLSPLLQTCSEFVLTWTNFVFQIVMGICFGFAVTAVSSALILFCWQKTQWICEYPPGCWLKLILVKFIKKLKVLFVFCPKTSVRSSILRLFYESFFNFCIFGGNILLAEARYQTLRNLRTVSIRSLPDSEEKEVWCSWHLPPLFNYPGHLFISWSISVKGSWPPVSSCTQMVTSVMFVTSDVDLRCLRSRLSSCICSWWACWSPSWWSIRSDVTTVPEERPSLWRATEGTLRPLTPDL